MSVVAVMNQIGVEWSGEMGLWFAVIKVGAIVSFLVVGIFVLGTGHEREGHTPGLGLIADNGGVFLHGILSVVLIIRGMLFTYSSIELVVTADGEAENPKEMVPRAINGVTWRILLFYIGSVALLVSLFPWTAYSANESPFFTFFTALGVPGMGSVMNIVVLIAALSSLKRFQQ